MNQRDRSDEKKEEKAGQFLLLTMLVIKIKLERSELNKLIEICVGTKEAVAVPS
jgi:hypothetical protein